MSQHILLNRRKLHSVNPAAAWADWDETSEDGLASDDIFVWLCENASAGGNETGQGGGYTGADLTITDKNASIGGATGSPPVRAHSGDDVLVPSINVAQDIINNNQCCIIIKVDTYANASASTDYSIWVDDYPESPRTSILVGHNGSGTNTLYLYATDDTGTIADAVSTNVIPSTGDLWLCFMCGTGYLRAGFCTSKPTKWSDFAVGDRISYNTTPQFSLGAYRTDSVGPGLPMTISGRVTFNSHYAVMSKSELIDPNG